jgi:4-phytase/acid phosphatase
MRLLSLGLSLIVFTAAAVGQEKASFSRDQQLVYAVYVIRHGVRSPTSDSSQYDRFSSAPWPKWSVPAGYLTPHGYTLVKLLGSYYRQELASRGLFTRKGCADSDRIAIHADSDQRTRETARALAEGAFPGCTIPIQARKEGTNDPLFHLPPASISPAQATSGAAAVLQRVGDDPEGIARAHHMQLAAFDHLLASCGNATPGHTRSSLFEVPASIAPGLGDHIVTMRGPLNTAGTLAENLLLEYAEGLPANEVGWGCVNGTELRSLINLHTEASDLAQRTPAVAVPQSSALLRVIDQSILQAISGSAMAGAEGRPGDKLLVLVGHDTNLLNLAGALNLNWRVDGRGNDTPPGSALVFEVWKDRRSETYSVRVFFTSQTLEQMRDNSALSEKNPPPKVLVSVRTCSRREDGHEISCFAHALENASAASDRAGENHTVGPALVPTPP